MVDEWDCRWRIAALEAETTRLRERVADLAAWAKQKQERIAELEYIIDQQHKTPCSVCGAMPEKQEARDG